jgi:hypothetical protein
VWSGFGVGGVDQGDGVAGLSRISIWLGAEEVGDDVLIAAVIQQPGQIFRLCRG